MDDVDEVEVVDEVVDEVVEVEVELVVEEVVVEVDDVVVLVADVVDVAVGSKGASGSNVLCLGTRAASRASTPSTRPDIATAIQTSSRKRRGRRKGLTMLKVLYSEQVLQLRCLYDVLTAIFTMSTSLLGATTATTTAMVNGGGGKETKRSD